MSITLTSPVVLTINGITETDTIGVCTSIVQNFQAMTMTVTYNIGTALTGTPLGLNQGTFSITNGYTLTVLFNLNTGVWSYTYAGNSGGGTLTGTTLTTQQTQFIAARNQMESFVAVAGGLMPGTIVSWTAL